MVNFAVLLTYGVTQTRATVILLSYQSIALARAIWRKVDIH